MDASQGKIDLRQTLPSIGQVASSACQKKEETICRESHVMANRGIKKRLEAIVRLLPKADDMAERQSILVQSKKMLMQCPLSFSHFYEFSQIA